MNSYANKQRLQISDLAALYVLIWTITPMLASGIIYRIILLGCAGLWILNKISFIKAHRSELFLMVTLLVGYFITQFLSYDTNHALSWTVNIGLYVVIALIGMYYNYNKKDIIPIFIFVLLSIIILVSIISIKTVIADPFALRRATYSLEDRGHTYGAYSFIYMLVQLLPYLFFVLLNRRNDYTKSILAIIFISFAVGWVLLLISGFTIANATVGMSMIMLILFRNFNIRKLIIIVVSIFVIAITYRYILELIFSVIQNIVADNALYERKIQDLYNQLVLGGGTGGSYEGRLELYKKSWETLIRNPIFGSAFLIGEDTTGGHCTLVDIMANSGIIVAILFYWLIIRLPVRIIKNNDLHRSYRYLIVIFLFLVIVIGLIDTLTYTCAWVWYLFIPYIASNYNSK